MEDKETREYLLQLELVIRAKGDDAANSIKARLIRELLRDSAVEDVLRSELEIIPK